MSLTKILKGLRKERFPLLVLAKFHMGFRGEKSREEVMGATEFGGSQGTLLPGLGPWG